MKFRKLLASTLAGILVASSFTPINAVAADIDYELLTDPGYKAAQEAGTPTVSEEMFWRVYEYVRGYRLRRQKDNGECGGRICEEQNIGESLVIMLILADELKRPQDYLLLADICLILGNMQCVKVSLNDALAAFDTYNPPKDRKMSGVEQTEFETIYSSVEQNGVTKDAMNKAVEYVKKSPLASTFLYVAFIQQSKDVDYFLGMALSTAEMMRYEDVPPEAMEQAFSLAKDGIQAVINWLSEY